MDVETGSTNTSLDDKTEDFCENPTRDTLAEGLLCLLKPTVDQLDERVKATRITQLELKQQIDGLAEELRKIFEAQGSPVDLEAYTNKLINARQKITVVSNILQAAQDRLQKVESQISRETAGRRSLLEPTPSASAALDIRNHPSVQ